MKGTIRGFLILITVALTFSLEVPKPRITNGNTASLGQFPFAVNLNIKTNSVESKCGGSLIGHEWVVTAAHCVQNSGDITINLGSINGNTLRISVTVPSINVIIHPDFNPRNFYNDIALIKIPYVSYSYCIKPIALPAYSSPLHNYNNTQGTIIGWGVTSSGNLANDLQYAEAKVLSFEECSKQLNFIDSMICVSSIRSSICIGDFGGPLVINGVLVGIASFVKGCSFGFPAAFTRVTSFLWFIKSSTGISNETALYR